MVAPDHLRPSPFDGMRMLYTEDADEVLEVNNHISRDRELLLGNA